MTTTQTIRIAIISDAHAFRKGEDGEVPSWIDLTEDQASPTINPFAGLRHLFSEDKSIVADIIVCGGDLGDKASPDGLQYVWNEINKLRDPLQAQLVLGTAGNHDMDSRLKYTDFDAKGQLQVLDPPFPVENRTHWMEYWAKNYTVFDFKEVRFVLLNSAAYHGYNDVTGQPECLHGRISDRTLNSLTVDLKSGGKRAANIFICHHHPLKNEQIKVSDYSEMKNGDRLLNGLVEAKVGPWLIIHGHKHLPRLIYAPGGNTAPTIFSAGSFAAKLWEEYGDRARNEFYILELEIPPIGATSTVKGAIAVWQWTYGNGWKRSRDGGGLGAAAAFGARLDIADEANKLARNLKSTNSGQSVAWKDVCSQNPNLRYLIPEDLKGFLEHLTNDHRFRPLRDDFGEISELQVPDDG